LNIGAEDHKGDEMHQEAYKLLKDSSLNFVGNIEGRELLDGDVDVVVTDGFSGNIALKSMEGTALTVMKIVKNGLLSSTLSKIGALLAKGSLKSSLSEFDYKSVGGALMMGFTKAIVKAHGGSDAKAFRSAMELAYTMVENDVVEKMKEGLE
jgi:glycerol-3-phosphate acyltransferase PlsX